MLFGDYDGKCDHGKDGKGTKQKYETFFKYIIHSYLAESKNQQQKGKRTISLIFFKWTEEIIFFSVRIFLLAIQELSYLSYFFCRCDDGHVFETIRKGCVFLGLLEMLGPSYGRA